MAIASLNRRPISRYQAPSPPLRRAPPPLPPRWVARDRRVEMPPLWQFVLLSLLLHVLAISLVGAPSGGSRQGRALWGSLDVVLKPARPAEAPSSPAPSGTGALDALPAPLPFPQLLDRIATAQPKRETTPKLVVPPPIEAQPAPSVAIPAPLAKAPPARPAYQTLVDSPVVLQAPAPSVAIPQPLQKLPAARPAYQTLTDAPVVMQAPPSPAPMIEAPPVVIDAPRVMVAPARPQTERLLQEAPPVLVAPAPSPPPLPAPTPAPESLVLPRAPEPVPRPLDPSITRELALPAPGSPSADRTPRLDPAARIERDAPLRPPVEPALSPFRSGPPMPRADEAASYDPTAPAMDAEALRKRAASLAREGSGQRAVLPFPMPPVPDKKGKIEDILDKARKPDCRTAYQQLGLAAIIPLLANELGEGTCRW